MGILLIVYLAISIFRMFPLAFEQHLTIHVTLMHSTM